MRLEEAPVIGRVGPRPDGLDAPFWEALGHGRLALQFCPACEHWIWGPQWLCPRCHRMGPEWRDTPARGTVFSWIRTWQPFSAEFAEKLPYVSVVVELAGAGGRRLVGLLLGDPLADPRLGEPVEGVVQPASGLTGQVPVLRWRREETEAI